MSEQDGPDESEEVPEGDHDVGVVRSGLLDHAAKLSVAVGSHLEILNILILYRDIEYIDIVLRY